ncbi:MAG: adenosine deaminase [Bacilli bacterium]|nr:adenosine deaminase [Bacilli bacterium]
MNNLVELHLHLDGALSINNCRKLAKLQNIDITQDDNELGKMLMVPDDCHDLNEFLTKFEFPLTLLQTKEGIKESIINLQEELLEQGVIYAEIRFAPQLHLNKGLNQDEVVAAAIEGLNASKLRSNLILCCMRGNDNHDANMETVRIAKKYLGQGVCAIDLAGAEGLFPTKIFEDIFKYARELNIPFTIHAGEADGPSSVSDAIRFGAKRIGHGVRAYEDSYIVNLIKDLDITLEVCPTSNLCTCIYNQISEMPIKYFMDNGIKITINTDDPTVCNTKLKDELKLVANAFNLTYEDIIELEKNAINASFANSEVKLEVLRIIDN